MKNSLSSIDLLFERVEDYGKSTFELSKLKLLSAGIVVSTMLVSRLSILMMIFMFTLVFSIGIGLWLGDLLGKVHYGFFIVAGFYLLLSLIFIVFLHKWIKKPISNFFIKQVFP